MNKKFHMIIGVFALFLMEQGFTQNINLENSIQKPIINQVDKSPHQHIQSPNQLHSINPTPPHSVHTTMQARIREQNNRIIAETAQRTDASFPQIPAPKNVTSSPHSRLETTAIKYRSAYGESSLTHDHYGFTGERYDSDANAIYLRGRYYDPKVGVFLSRDPYPGKITNPLSRNRYAYMHGNPVNGTDPSGYFALMEHTAANSIRNILAETQLNTGFAMMDAIEVGEVNNLQMAGFGVLGVAGGKLIRSSVKMKGIASIISRGGDSAKRLFRIFSKKPCKEPCILPYVSRNASLNKLTASEITRIQNAANRHQVEIHVVGSRVNPQRQLHAGSDWDYVIFGSHQKRKNTLKSLPGAKNVKTGERSNQDNFYDEGLDLTLPHVIFKPQK